MMAVAASRRSWYRSFYWRISITFVVFVVGFLIIQGILLRRTGTTVEFPPELLAGPVLAAEVAASVGDMLVRGQFDELRAHLRSKYPLPSEDQLGWIVYVATYDKMMTSKPGPLPGIVRATALAAWGRRRLTTADRVGDIPTAPVVVDGKFVGLVLVL